jgi:hypothetical protein
MMHVTASSGGAINTPCQAPQQMAKGRVVPALWRMGETPRTHDEPGRRAAGVLSQVISTTTAPSPLASSSQLATTSSASAASDGSTPEDLSIWDSHAGPADRTEPQAGLSELKEWTRRLEEVR